MKSSEFPRGVTLRKRPGGKTSIQVAFTYMGRHCRETLPGLKITKENIRYAADLLGGIRNDIDRGKFDYHKRFPHSKFGRTLAGGGKEVTVGQLLDEVLDTRAARYAESSMVAIRSMVNGRLKTGLGSFPAATVTTGQIMAWLDGDEFLGLSRKYVTNLLTPLRQAMKLAIRKNLRDDNPADARVLAASDSSARGRGRRFREERHEPFSRAEVTALIAASTDGPERNFVRFAFETGLRTGELIGLRWSDVDFEAGVVLVRHVIVQGNSKGPKTRAGRRSVAKSSAARAALEQQRETTGKSSMVFCHPKTGLPLRRCHDIYAFWTNIVTRAGVRFRSPRLTRHTYASLQISERGVNLFWLAGQMGHVGTQMLNRHYGKFIDGNDVYTGGRVGPPAVIG